MTTPTPADDLCRRAARELREAPDARPHDAAVAEWLEHEAEIAAGAHLWAEREPCGWCGNPANHHTLATARAVLGEEEVQR